MRGAPVLKMQQQQAYRTMPDRALTPNASLCGDLSRHADVVDRFGVVATNC